MKSGDLSVFWQEIIDSYRDIMVVKNSKRAKSYLDLTEAEYSVLSEIASGYSMAKLSYHVSLLEDSMADMQRAFNSKRAIAEIALTRMCDSRLSASDEALALRVEELERALKMITLGVTAVSAPVSQIENKSPKLEQKPKQKAEEPKEQPKPEKNELRIYGDWGTVIKKIGELKMSLSAGLSGASAYTDGRGNYVLRMGDFFAKKLSSSDTDMAIIRGVIAENEGKNAAEIAVTVEGASKAAESKNELEDLFK